MRSRKKGFTIIEILIAIVILTVGILGILAIFPKAIESASKSIEDTYAGVIAQSVMDSVKTGIRETKVTRLDSGKTTKYFLMQHDGIGFRSSPTKKINTLIFSGSTTNFADLSDYQGSVVLPIGSNDRFLYPKGLNSGQFQGSALTNDTKKVLGLYNSKGDATDSQYERVTEIYTFGNRPGLTGVSRLQQILNTSTNPTEVTMLRKDPYLSYGFAVAVNRSVLNNGQPSDDLYFFNVLIFRNWISAMGHRAYKPLRSLSSLVAF